MACTEMPTENIDSEREEGEIVDDLDDLSDISSEEEFLLRQRLEILENYNNVLERKEAKRTSNTPKNIIWKLNDIESKPSKCKRKWPDFSSLQYTEVVPQIQVPLCRATKNEKHSKKSRKLKETEVAPKVDRKKHGHTKKLRSQKVVSESSEDSNDEEYIKKRRKLADAVSFNTKKVDNSSLKDRIANMLNPKPKNHQMVIQNTVLAGSIVIPDNNNRKLDSESITLNKSDSVDKPDTEIIVQEISYGRSDDETKITTDLVEPHDTVDGVNKDDTHKTNSGEGSSDEDLESLRLHALKSKCSKPNLAPPDIQNVEENKLDSDDEDSDTEELRLICLRSALLKKAIEMKKQQKLQKRMSQSSILQDDLIDKLESNGNNTDVENIDMDIGSDAEERDKNQIIEENQTEVRSEHKIEASKPVKLNKEDELEEDEDLLRARLLTSLSKNLPILADVSTVENPILTQEEPTEPKKELVKKIHVPEKKFIIELGDSDSEVEHEATKNLTKMHMKLAEQTEFQLKLDQFLKSTRKQVENNSLPDVVQPQVPLNKPPQKFVPKAMNHLPRSEQIEYKNLVRRMAELEKIKKSRQLSLNSMNKHNTDMLKPINNRVEVPMKNLEDKIAESRKKIAEESAKMLKLKEEATKLSQRHKIVSNELRNITTAITLNRKQQRAVQNGLAKIRLQHQMLLKSTTLKHSSSIVTTNLTSNKTQNIINRPQKENNPSLKEHKNPNVLKTVKVSVVNDLNKDIVPRTQKMSIEVDVSSNKKIVKMPKTTKERVVDINKDINESENPLVENVESKNVKEEVENKTEHDKDKSDANDYISPLDALGQTGWKADPNAFLCPFEVSGSCRDSDCKFLHIHKQ